MLTFNSKTDEKPGHTLGGYSQRIVVDDKFVLKVTHPEQQLAAVAPLLCAGITTYSPLRRWKVGPGMKVGIVGIGGLGHMGIKFAHALGAHTVAFTTSQSKRQDALDLGADEVIVSRDGAEMEKHAGSFDSQDHILIFQALTDTTAVSRKYVPIYNHSFAFGTHPNRKRDKPAAGSFEEAGDGANRRLLSH